MHWIAHSEKETTNGTLENHLWDSAGQFRANSGLKSQEYSAPVLRGISYCDDPHDDAVCFDFVLANSDMSSSHSEKGGFGRSFICQLL